MGRKRLKLLLLGGVIAIIGGTLLGVNLWLIQITFLPSSAADCTGSSSKGIARADKVFRNCRCLPGGMWSLPRGEEIRHFEVNNETCQAHALWPLHSDIFTGRVAWNLLSNHPKFHCMLNWGHGQTDYFRRVAADTWQSQHFSNQTLDNKSVLVTRWLSGCSPGENIQAPKAPVHTQAAAFGLKARAWTLSVSGENCNETCTPYGACSVALMKSLQSKEDVSYAVQQAGEECDSYQAYDVVEEFNNSWDGPWWQGGFCGFTMEADWQPNCHKRPRAGHQRICGCLPKECDIGGLLGGCREFGLSKFFSVYHCPAEGNSTGHFLISAPDFTRMPLFRIRLVGPSIEVLSTTRQAGCNILRADYHLCETGTYLVEVAMPFTDFQDPDDQVLVRKNHPCLAASAREINQTENTSVGTFEHAFYMKFVAYASRNSVFCNEKRRHGYWVDPAAVNNPDVHATTAVGEYLWHTYAARKQYLPALELYSGLRFQKEGSDCIGHRLPKLGIQKRHICFIGDSHLRMLNQWSRAAIAEGSFHNVDSEYCHSNKNRKVPHLLQRCYGMLKNCTDIVVNFGAWQLGHPLVQSRNPTRSYSTCTYKKEISVVLDHLTSRSLNPSGASVFWMLLNPHPFHGELLSCPPEGYRFPHMIERYNEAAMDILNSPRWQHKVGYVDNHEIARHLNDLSVDGHYQQPVVLEQLTNLYNCLDITNRENIPKIVARPF